MTAGGGDGGYSGGDGATSPRWMGKERKEMKMSVKCHAKGDTWHPV